MNQGRSGGSNQGFGANQGFGGTSGNKPALDKFQQLKASLAGRLFEDSDFPAGPTALGRTGTLAARFANKRIQWLRPKEIGPNPRFIVENESRFDLNQGSIQDCWVIAATACLATSAPQLLQRVVPSDQEFDSNYAGIFRFNFWHFDVWTEVCIDDRLPTSGGRLLFGSNNSQPNEFWVPLLEKAYAKLYGGYENLEGGFTNNALVDFTGGISEFIDIKILRNTLGRAPATSARGQPSTVPDLYDRLYEMMQKSSMIGSHIEASRIPEDALPSGLYTGHAYSITNLVKLKVQGKVMRLMRLRNPWGWGEWKGAWCDKSKAWLSVPEKVRLEVGMTVNEDGEFWMSYEDWLNNFEFVTLCHLNPDSVTQEIEKDRHRNLWAVQKHQSEWVRGFSAGGCGNSPYEKLLWRNPQFGVTLGSSSSARRAPGGGEERCHMVVSLMQEQENDNLKTPLAISLFLYRLDKGLQILDGQKYDGNALKIAKSAPPFTNLREVTVYYDVTPGNYIIIPTTFEPDKEGKFLVRIYTETQTQSQELDVKTTMAAPAAIQDDIESIFKKWSGGDDKIDAKELVNGINQVLTKEGFSPFGIETSRCMVAMYDKDKSGLLSFDEFKRLITELRTWKDKFVAFDADRSGNIDTYELMSLFQSIGFGISRMVQKAIIQRYGGKSSRLSLDDFLHCTCKLVTVFGEFVRMSKNGISGSAQLSLDQWLASTIYC